MYKAVGTQSCKFCMKWSKGEAPCIKPVSYQSVLVYFSVRPLRKWVGEITEDFFELSRDSAEQVRAFEFYLITSSASSPLHDAATSKESTVAFSC